MKRILVVSIVSVLVVIFNVWVGAAAQNERVVVLEAEVQPALPCPLVQVVIAS